MSQIPVPQRLDARTREWLAGREADAEGCLDTAIGIARGLLATGDISRAIALDLLVADALVTRAMELDRSSDDDRDARCVDAMRRLAATASEP